MDWSSNVFQEDWDSQLINYKDLEKSVGTENSAEEKEQKELDKDERGSKDEHGSDDGKSDQDANMSVRVFRILKQVFWGVEEEYSSDQEYDNERGDDKSDQDANMGVQVFRVLKRAIWRMGEGYSSGQEQDDDNEDLIYEKDEFLAGASRVKVHAVVPRTPLYRPAYPRDPEHGDRLPFPPNVPGTPDSELDEALEAGLPPLPESGAASAIELSDEDIYAEDVGDKEYITIADDTETMEIFQEADRLYKSGQLLQCVMQYSILLRRETDSTQRLEGEQRNYNYHTEVKSSATARHSVRQMLQCFARLHGDIIRREPEACRDHFYFLARVLEFDAGKLAASKNIETAPMLGATLAYLQLALASAGDLRGSRRNRSISIIKFQDVMQDLGLQVFRQMEDALGSDHSEVGRAVRALAESYLHDAQIYNYPSGSTESYDRYSMLLDQEVMEHRRKAMHSWRPKETVIRRSLAVMEAAVEQGNPEILILRYLFARELLNRGETDAARDIFLAAFNEREAILGEQHTESSVFINDLIAMYCDECTGIDYYNRQRLYVHFFTKDLADMCFDHGDFSKTETLIQECPIPAEFMISTKASSRDKMFWPFDSRVSIQSFQGRVAESHTPDNQYYWEDTRMYSRKVAGLTLVPVSPTLEFPIPKAPAKILLRKEGLAVKISPECLTDAQEGNASLGTTLTERDVINMLKKMPIWDIISRKHAADSWFNRGYEHRHEWQNLDWKSQDALQTSPRTFWVFMEGRSKDPCYKIRRVNIPDSEYMVAPAYEKKARRPKDMRYTLEERQDGRIDLTVPFVPYAYFQKTRANRRGLTYRLYLDCLRYSMNRQTEELLGIHKQLCTENLTSLVSSDLKTWKISCEKEPGGIFQGIFNNIPSGAATFRVATTFDGFNLVSSAWSDWKGFTLHEEPLVFVLGNELVRCPGYIMGTWTSYDLSTQWTGLKFFIIDAEFSVDGLNERCLFAINPGSLTTHNEHKCKWLGETLTPLAEVNIYYQGG